VSIPAPASHANDGVHTITYYSTDTAGNVELTETTTVRIDTAAPTTTASNLQATNNSGWSNAAVTVTLAAADSGGSGLGGTTYQIDGGAPATYGGPFTVSAPGSHAIVYHSTDAAGNTGATGGGYVNIDGSLPVTTDDDPAGWKNTAQTVTLSPSDSGGSGLASTLYKVDGGSYTAGRSVSIPAPASHANDGVHTITYYSTGVGGNTEAPHSCTVRIDTRGATIALAAFKYKAGKLAVAYRINSVALTTANGGWATVKLTVDSAKSRKVVKTFVQLQKPVNAKQKLSLKIKLAKGAYTVKVSATDAAGNVSAIKAVKLTVK